jgi:hypothetical protein
MPIGNISVAYQTVRKSTIYWCHSPMHSRWAHHFKKHFQIYRNNPTLWYSHGHRITAAAHQSIGRGTRSRRIEQIEGGWLIGGGGPKLYQRAVRLNVVHLNADYHIASSIARRNSQSVSLNHHHDRIAPRDKTVARSPTPQPPMLCLGS